MFSRPPDHSPTTQAFGMSCHSDLRWWRSWDACAKDPCSYPLTGLPVQVGKLRSLGVNGNPRISILDQHFFYLALWLPKGSPSLSGPHTQPSEGGPQQMGVRQTPSPLPHPSGQQEVAKHHGATLSWAPLSSESPNSRLILDIFSG